jgi:mannosyltransferase OCH1-like enzyme
MKFNIKSKTKIILISTIIILIILLIVFLYKNNTKKIINEAFNNDSSVNKPEIPKVIYMCHKNIDDIKKYSENWKRLNPEYEIKLYDNELSEQFLLKEFSQLHYDIFKYIPDGPIKADFWRVCIIYKYGGLYVDADINPLIPLKDYIEKDVDFVTCISGNFNPNNEAFKFNPHFIMARPGDSILNDCINRYIDFYNKKDYSYWIWSICNLFIIKNVNENKSGIHYDGNKKYQFLLEMPDFENCEYNGVIVLKNRYDNYKDHNFI